VCGVVVFFVVCFGVGVFWGFCFFSLFLSFFFFCGGCLLVFFFVWVGFFFWLFFFSLWFWV